MATVLSLEDLASAEEPAPSTPATTSSALPLGVSYAVLPVLTGGALLAFADANETTGAVVVTGVIVAGLAAPIIVHASNGESRRALVSPFAAVGSAAVGFLVGGLVALPVIGETCPDPPTRPNQEHDDSCNLKTLVIATSIGAFVGYATWGTFDTIENSSTTTRPTVTLAPRLSRTSAGLDLVGSF